jgi:Icc-related predicted phosphoesterase
MTSCIDAYQDARPDIVVSHVPPSCFVPELTKSDKMLIDFGFHAGFRENTSLFCNELLMYHQPRLWISGHFHKSHVSHIVAGLKFVSLAELETYDILDSL